MSSTQSTLTAVLIGALLAAPSFAATQTGLEPAPAPTPIPSTVQDELLQMATQAGVIFSGEVLSVTPRESFTPGTGTVEIVFRIDQSIRGCGTLSTYTLREWSGLWTGGDPRYTPGQRLLVLLHSPSASGLGSPVGGQDGLIPITGAGAAPKPTDNTVAQNEPAVDLRWVQARLPRATALLQNTRAHSFTAANPTYAGHEQAPLATRKIALPTMPRSAPAPMPMPMPMPSLAESPNTLPLTPSKGISLRGILAILGAWQTQQTDAPH